MQVTIPREFPRRRFTSFVSCLLLACSLTLLPISNVFALPTRDAVSDRVGATAGSFRVDESGSATYSIPLYTPPGTAGVVPQMALSYSSQGGNGVMGRGWGINGTSGISRCRATRENGDFISGGIAVDGDPAPVNYTSSDRFCLDGQRLIPAPAAAAACKVLSGATAVQYRTELESFQRVCAYTFTSANGPRFFTVERKDGSTSWYGDRVSTTGTETGPRTDGGIVVTGLPSVLMAWSQTRFQDSAGNYIDYLYSVNPAGASYPGEQVLSEVRYTGKVVLPGQTGTAKSTYAKLTFNYATLPVASFTTGYASGMAMWQTQRLNSVTVTNGATTVRHYVLTYGTSLSGTGATTLTSLKECSNTTQSVCYPPTTFDWSVARNQLTTSETPADINIGAYDNFEGYKLADVDGDGRQDMVYLRDGNIIDACPTESVSVAFSIIDSNGLSTFSKPTQTEVCTPTELMSVLGDDSWMLFDYNGDGRDDLFMSGSTSGSWVLYPSLGKPTSGGKVFDNLGNLISGLSPAIPGSVNNAHPQLGDFNGDGLLDVIYTRSSTRYIRLMTRNGASFSWGAERTVQILTNLNDDCTGDTLCNTSPASLYRKNGSFQLLDFNGDSRSDLLTTFTKTYTSYGPGCEPQIVAGPTDTRTSTSSSSALVGNCMTKQKYTYLVALNVTSITATQVSLSGNWYWQTKYEENNVPISVDQSEQRFADFNGDGLTDLLARVNTSGNSWSLWVNTGKGFQNLGTAFTANNTDFLQVVDINGDGRADVVSPNSTFATFNVRYGVSTGGFTTASLVPGGVNLINCSDFCMNRFSYIFSDFDGDGGLDFFRIKWVTSGGSDPNQRLFASRADSVSRFQPRDVLIRITNGYGAKTELAYAPLTMKHMYLRDYDSRNATNWGRGSPVQDMLAPMYVVAMARSSAPTYNNAAAMSTLYYRYAGAKIQAGGRGYLGFREITTYDVNYGGKYIVTTSQYAQNFPYIGSPISTSRRVITGTYSVDACYTTITDACFSTPGTTYPAFGGVLVSNSSQVWESAPAFNSALQEPLQTRTAGTQDEQYDLGTGIRTNRVNTAFTYTTFGNVSLTSVDTYTGTDNSSPASVSTSNTYINDETAWRLGRMTASSVTHTRNGSSIVRATSYDYDMAGAVAGFLKAERLQPSGDNRQDLRTEYDLDEYGNRIATYTCSQNVTTCKTTTLNHPIWDSFNTVHRYSRVSFDADGRYPVTSSEPFRTSGSAWDSGQTTETVTQTILARDEFGEPTQVQDVNGRVAASMNGEMGRDYWSWAPTASMQTVGATGLGSHSFKTYRFCGTGTDQVACPTNAVFREQVSTSGAATKWTYFDVLGRPILAAAQSFNENQLAKDFAATCQWYDNTGKTYGSSNPFFLTDAAISGAPQFATNPCVLANRDVNYTVYDVLARPTQVILADSSSTSMAYNGLSTTTTNALNQTKTELKNGSGELVTATDHLGFSTQYAYNAAGNLTTVTRNAGRGNIVTTMTYDALGRKISMVDPDAGTWYYSYTPAGELERTLDAAGNAQFKRYDFRGRVVWEGRQTAANVGTSNFESSAISIFDSAPNGLGQLHSSAITGLYTGWSATPDRSVNQSQGLAYDDMGRVLTTTTQIDSVNYNSAVVYDSLGRSYKAQDPTGKWTKTEYTPRGYAIRVCSSDANDSAPGCISGNANTYLETLATDARGNVISDKRGGSASMITQRSYDPFTGRISQICAGSGGANCQILSEQYGWDAVGNLQYQEKALYREEFSYDGLNRVTEGRFSRVGTTSYVGAARPYSLSNTYDLLGNLCNRLIDGVNQNYSYAGRSGCGLNGSGGNVNGDMVTSPHQVQGANGYIYAYDAHGNQTMATHGTSSKSRSISYTVDDRAYEMTKGSDVTRFWYGIGGDRYKRVDVSGVGAKTTINVANLEIETLNGVTTTKRTVAGVLVEETKNNVTTNKYLHHDQLGSVARITDASGSILESMDYAAFGDRRNVIDPRQPFINGGQVSNGTLTLPSGQILTLYSTKRGFTGHEMVDGFDIVHMNGRIYDNMIGRFLQADPVVQDPSNTQNFNRYTYVWNNPLAYTDPSGYFSFRNFFNGFTQLVSFISYFVPGLQMFAAILNGLSAYVNGGLKGGLLNAFSSMVPLPGNPIGRILGSMIIAGANSVIMGGKFAQGAIGTLKSAAIAFVMQNLAVGLDSVQTGQKFKAVDVTGSNNESNSSDSQASTPVSNEQKVKDANTRLDNASVGNDIAKGGFKTQKAARVAAALAYAPDAYLANREANWLIVKLSDGTWGYTYPNVGRVGQVAVKTKEISDVMKMKTSNGLTVRSIDSIGHNHLKGDLNFSGTDYKLVNLVRGESPSDYDGMTIWLWNPDGKAFSYTGSKWSSNNAILQSFEGNYQPGHNIPKTW